MKQGAMHRVMGGLQREGDAILCLFVFAPGVDQGFFLEVFSQTLTARAEIQQSNSIFFVCFDDAETNLTFLMVF